MIEYKNRTYREHLQKERWYSFTVAYKETDLWIGIDQASFQESIPAFTESRIRTLRESMDAYLQNDPDYATSLVSYEAKSGAPTIFQEMSEVARKSGIGPMSAVAGAVASRIGQEIKEKYGFDANAIVSMAEVTEYLYNKPYKGQVYIDDTLKAAIDAYYAQYGAK